MRDRYAGRRKFGVEEADKGEGREGEGSGESFEELGQRPPSARAFVDVRLGVVCFQVEIPLDFEVERQPQPKNRGDEIQAQRPDFFDRLRHNFRCPREGERQETPQRNHQ